MNYKLKLSLYNATGINPKIDNILNYIDKENVDIACVTETWMKNNSPKSKFIFAHSVCRNGNNKGMAGTGFIINKKKCNYKFKQIKTDNDNGRYSVMASGNLVIVLVYLSPALEVNETLEILEEALEYALSSSNNQIILLGDFNCNHTNLLSKSNCERGISIFNFMRRLGFCLRNTIDTMNFTNCVPGCHPSIIDLVWTKNILSIGNTKIQNNYYLGKSTHKIVECEMELRSIDVEPQIRCNVLNISKLNNESVISEIRKELKEPLQAVNEKIITEFNVLRSANSTSKEIFDKVRPLVSQLEKEMTTTINTTVEKYCGTKTIVKDRKNIIQNPAIIALNNQLNALHKLCIKFPHNSTLTVKRELCLNELEKERKIDKEKSFDNFTKILASQKKVEQQKAVKRIMKKKYSYIDNELSNSPEKMNEAVKYFGEIFDNKLVTSKHSGFAWKLSEFEQHDALDVIFDECAISNIIKYLPSHKAPGESKLMNETLKCINSEITPVLSSLFKLCVLTGTIPKSWSATTIVPVYKKGDKSKVENYRPISLLENIRKVFERCLYNYFIDEIKPLEIQQGGFQRAKSTLDQVACLHEFIKCYKKNYKKFPLVCYLDIKAAYDSVDRSILYDDCIKKGINIVFVETLRQLFDFNVAKIRINNRNSRTFPLLSGVQQGSILSPLLYTIFIEKIIVALRNGPGLRIDKRLNANCLLYADDIALIARNEADMNTLLRISLGTAERNNFNFNVEKSVYSAAKTCDLYLGADKLERAVLFNYLGISFDFKGINPAEFVKQKKNKVESTTSFFNTLGLNACGFNLQTKILVYKTFIRSKLEYGLQILYNSRKSINLLEKIQYKSLCTMFSINNKSSYSTLLIITNLLNMESRTKWLKAKWLKRYECLENDSTMLLPTVEKWVERNGLINEIEATGKCTQIELNSDFPEAQQMKLILHDFMHHLKKEIKMFREYPFENLNIENFQKCLRNKSIPRKDVQLIILFCLNKIPGAPLPCKRCNRILSKTHLVECNLNIWITKIEEIFRIQNLKREIIKINEFFKNYLYWPQLLILLASNCIGKNQSKVIEIVVQLLKESFAKCSSFRTNS